MVHLQRSKQGDIGTYVTLRFQNVAYTYSYCHPNVRISYTSYLDSIFVLYYNKIYLNTTTIPFIITWVFIYFKCEKPYLQVLYNHLVFNYCKCEKCYLYQKYISQNNTHRFSPIEYIDTYFSINRSLYMEFIKFWQYCDIFYFIWSILHSFYPIWTVQNDISSTIQTRGYWNIYICHLKVSQVCIYMFILSP